MNSSSFPLVEPALSKNRFWIVQSEISLRKEGSVDKPRISAMLADRFCVGLAIQKIFAEAENDGQNKNRQKNDRRRNHKAGFSLHKAGNKKDYRQKQAAKSRQSPKRQTGFPTTFLKHDLVAVAPAFRAFQNQTFFAFHNLVFFRPFTNIL